MSIKAPSEARQRRWPAVVTAALIIAPLVLMLLSHVFPPQDPVTLHRAPTAEPVVAAAIRPEERTVSHTEAPAPDDVSYILNLNTRKFHRPGCSSVGRIKEQNRADFTGTREEAIRMGYAPCGSCKP